MPSLSLFSYRPDKLPMLLCVLSTLSLSQFGPCQYLSPFLSPVHFNHTGNTGICSLSLLLTQSSIPFLDKFLFTYSSGLPIQGKLPSLLPANWAEMMTKLMMVILSKCRPNSQRQMYLKIDRGSLPLSLSPISPAWDKVRALKTTVRLRVFAISRKQKIFEFIFALTYVLLIPLPALGPKTWESELRMKMIGVK